jgi:hypothetical protein
MKWVCSLRLLRCLKRGGSGGGSTARHAALLQFSRAQLWPPRRAGAASEKGLVRRRPQLVGVEAPMSVTVMDAAMTGEAGFLHRMMLLLPTNVLRGSKQQALAGLGLLDGRRSPEGVENGRSALLVLVWARCSNGPRSAHSGSSVDVIMISVAVSASFDGKQACLQVWATTAAVCLQRGCGPRAAGQVRSAGA